MDREEAKARSLAMLRRAGILLRPDEAANLEIADLGLGDLEHVGLQIVVYVNTERCCAKELVLLPRQICPEHRHPPIRDYPGKEETFRCRYGRIYLYVPGPKTTNPHAVIPESKKSNFTVWHEVELNPGDQCTLRPDTPHWFQAGPEGAIVSEFSTKSIDEADVFTDPEIKR
jgi:D-lyxose ketol-isomerase